MTKNQKIIASSAIVLSGLLIIGGFSSYRSHKKKVLDAQTAIMNQDLGRAAENDAQAKRAEKAALEREAKLAADDALVARLKKERANLTAKLAARDAQHSTARPSALEPVGTNTDLVAELRAVIIKDDVLFAAYETQVAGLKLQIIDLSVRGNSYKAEVENLRGAIVALNITHEAQISLMKTDMWKIRFKYGTLSFASGFAAGKLL